MIIRFIIFCSFLLIVNNEFDLFPKTQIGNNKHIFFSLYDVSINEDAIYVTDQLGYKIDKFSLDGKLIKSIGRKGRGPGEFITGPAQITINKDTLYICDGAGIRYIHLFTKELKYIKSYTIDKSVTDFKSHNNQFYIAANSSVINPVVSIFNSNFIEESHINLMNKSKNLRANEHHILVNDKYLFVIYKFRNLIQLYSLSGKFIREFSIKGIKKEVRFERKKEIEKTISKKVNPQIAEYYYNWPQGIICRTVHFYKNDYLVLQSDKYKCLIIDLEGNIKAMFTLKKNSDLMETDKNNKILISENSFTKLILYELIKK
jgi:hypothetical protein